MSAEGNQVGVGPHTRRLKVKFDSGVWTKAPVHDRLPEPAITSKYELDLDPDTDLDHYIAAVIQITDHVSDDKIITALNEFPRADGADIIKHNAQNESGLWTVWRYCGN